MAMTVHCVFMLDSHLLININARDININVLDRHRASKRDMHYDDLNEVIAKHSYGRHSIPVVLLSSPEDKYRARVAKHRHAGEFAAPVRDSERARRCRAVLAGDQAPSAQARIQGAPDS